MLLLRRRRRQTSIPLVPADHPVQQDQIRRILGSEKQGLVAIVGGAHVVSLATKPVFDQFGKRGIVFNQKQFRGRHGEPP